MKGFNFIPVFFITLIFLLIVSCNQNDEQRQFEREAFSLPENITETKNGIDIEGNEDPDDWRIGPYFQGVISFEKIPNPNPLLPDQQLIISLFVTSLDAVSGLRVLALYNENSLQPLYEDPRSPIPTGITPIFLSARDIAQFADNPQGLYRIIVEDRQGGIITYGDVRID